MATNVLDPLPARTQEELSGPTRDRREARVAAAVMVGRTEVSVTRLQFYIMSMRYPHGPYEQDMNYLVTLACMAGDCQWCAMHDDHLIAGCECRSATHGRIPFTAGHP